MLAGLYGYGMATAQSSDSQEKSFWATDTQFASWSVNNEGQAIISNNWNDPFNIWTPQTGNIQLIGGVSAGNNVGGEAHFTDDGKTIGAVMHSDKIAVSTSWQKTQFDDMGVNFKDISRVPMSANLFAIGGSDDGQKGLMLKNTDKGKTWRVTNIAVNNPGETTTTNGWKGGLEFICWQSWMLGYTGGQNGCFYYTQNSGTQWDAIDPHPAGNTDEVNAYLAMDFIPIEENYLYKYGVLGLELADGSGAVWYSTDAVESFNVSSGLGGVPASITHTGETYYMATRNGLIQKSEDYGKTWSTVFDASASVSPYATDGTPVFNRIKFFDDNNGIALGAGIVYMTTDNGKTWTEQNIAEGTENITWNGADYMDGTVTIVGGEGCIYETSDMGETWNKVEIDVVDGIDLMGIVANTEAMSICGTDGTFFYKGHQENVSGYTAALYDVENDEWTPLPATGYFSGETASSGWDISGDGSTVVGGVYTYEQLSDNSAIVCEASAWVDGKLVKLGNKFAKDNRNSQARGVSYDGSVIVGWQDHHGPWYASVWRKNASGGYDQSLMLKDPDMTEDDLDTSYTQEGMSDMNSKLLGQANAVSADGKIIGGRGNTTNFAIDGPWLWSEEKGLQLLDPTPGSDYMVYDMTNDGQFVVGQVGSGASSFAWTEETGLVEMNQYLTSHLGIDMQGYYVCGVTDLSPNGRYMTGWCMKGQGRYAYVVDLKGNTTTSIERDLEQTKAAVYPNPVSDELHVDLPFEGVKTRISLYSLQGSCVKAVTTTDMSNVINVSDVPNGLYILDVNANGTHKSFKITIDH